MKKTTIFLFAIILSTSVFSQVFKTGQTLKPKTFSVGIEPAILFNGGNQFMLFLHGGYGIVSGVDFGVTIGALGNNNYFGADIEFAIGRRTSVSFGAHDFGSFGLDATLLTTIPLRSDVRIFAGGDLDVRFPKNNTQFLLWAPIGVEVGLKSNMSFIFEASIGLTDPAYHLIGAGVNFYL